MKKLAVLMPTYNCAIYLQESIDSILNQTYSEFDFYIYDDFSTDDSFKIISNYTDKRIFYIKNERNLGIAKTLNLGLEKLLPNYEYIARMDADDWCFPERFQKQVDFMDQHKEITMSGTQGFWLRKMSTNPVSGWEYPTKDDFLKYYLLFGASFGHSSVIFRTNFFLNSQLRYNQEIQTCEDWDLWIRVSRISQIANLPDFLMKYRIVLTSNHRLEKNKNTHLRERSVLISNYWKTFNIKLSPQQVFEFYYDTNKNIQKNFRIKLKIIIDSFNELFLNHANSLEKEDRKKIRYLLSRKMLDFWKRSNVSRYNLLIWFLILQRVKFNTKIRLIKSQLN
ncbi:glycosyltransferase family A protein [Flavobacterium sp. Arc3]|uniref:glycosyltransferase family 2 protein n=1 Tax=Flavobacterium sp. Arc3 TaxID=3046686 RepID=UPI00352BF642